MFTLKLECDPGSVIDKAVVEAKKTAIRLGISVEFMFNGVKMYATPNLHTNNSTDDAIQQYGKIVSSDNNFKFIVF